MRLIVVLLGAIVVACSPSAGKQTAVGVEQGSRVRDGARIMSVAVEKRLDIQLAKIEATTSDQVGIVTVPSLNGQSIEQFSLTYARRWGLGRNDWNNGVLVLVAPKEHKLRIEVGTGLEGLLTDARAQVIVRRMMVPLRAGNYDAGIELGVGEIENLLVADRKRPQPRLEPVRKAA